MEDRNHKEEHCLTIGVSACLAGRKVRFDGTDRINHYVTDTLARYFSVIPLCPEFEAGMGVPRETTNLVGSPESPRMVGNDSGEDKTARMERFIAKRVRHPRVRTLSGFVLKSKSPSCGKDSVKVFTGSDKEYEYGRGLFASAMIKRYPLMPIEEDRDLIDDEKRTVFIESVFGYYRLRRLFDDGFSPDAVRKFHRDHRLILFSHSVSNYRQLSKLVEKISLHSAEDFQMKYGHLYMETLRKKTTVEKNSKTLDKICGYLRPNLDNDERQKLRLYINEYSNQRLPLASLLETFKDLLNKNALPDIASQQYLNPHPIEVLLRDRDYLL